MIHTNRRRKAGSPESKLARVMVMGGGRIMGDGRWAVWRHTHRVVMVGVAYGEAGWTEGSMGVQAPGAGTAVRHFFYSLLSCILVWLSPGLATICALHDRWDCFLAFDDD